MRTYTESRVTRNTRTNFLHRTLLGALLSLLFIPGLQACISGGDTVAVNPGSAGKTLVNKKPGAPIPVDTFGPGALDQEKYQGLRITETSYKKSILYVSVGYSGCHKYKDGEVRLFWDGVMLRSFPPGARLTIAALKSADPGLCEMYITSTFAFDMRDLQRQNIGYVYLGTVGRAGIDQKSIRISLK